jgi:hypothetical protein
LNLCNEEIKIYIFENVIYLADFSKCISSNKNGTDYLNDIIRFSEELHKIIKTIKYIKLIDASTISINDCKDIDFQSYRIITKGNTWYNDFGFFSKNHKLDIEFFEMIRHSTLNELKDKYPNIFIENFEEKYAIIPLIKLIPLLENKLIGNYNDEICFFLSEILNNVKECYFLHKKNNVSYDIYYYYDLSKDDTTGGKRKTKRNKKNTYKKVNVKRSVKIYKRRRAQQPT